MEESGSVPGIASPPLKPAPAPMVLNTQPLVRPRYSDPNARAQIRQLVARELQHNLENMPDNNPKNLIKMLLVTASFPESRLIASRILEECFNNAAVTRFAKELLPVVAQHTNESSREDFETLTNILRLRLKGIFVQLYVDSVGQILGNNPAYPSVALKNFISIDMLQNKNNFNAKLLLTILKAIPGTQQLNNIAH